MRNLIKTGIIAFISAISLLFIFFATAQNQSKLQNEEMVFKNLELFADILARIQTDSVNIPDNQILIEAAINGMLHKLDAHSSYLNPKQFKALETSTKGEYSGVGIVVERRQNGILIVAPIEGTPAYKAGLKSKDLIIGVDGKSIIGEAYEDSINRVKGKPGTSVTLTIVRKDVKEPFLVTLKREAVKSKLVHTKIVDNYPVLRITGFKKKTTAQLKQAIRELRNDPKVDFSGLVLDLRGNPGGLLDQAVDVSDVFLKKGEIVSIKGRKESKEERFNGKTEDLLKGIPIVVLIDEGSASASEIVAGALQDRKWAIIVGEPSFGKGSVQSVIPLRGGRDGALRLTTSLYYTPSGHSIQGKGIIPDVLVSGTIEKPNKDLEHVISREANLANAIKNEEEVKDEDKPKQKIEYPPKGWPEKDDYQLKRAVEILDGEIKKG